MHALFGVLYFSAVGAGFLVNVFYNSEQRVRRAIKRSARYQVDSFREGKPGRITGVVVVKGGDGEDLHRAPLSGATCVYYEALASEFSQSGDNTPPIISDRKSVVFGVDDGTGVAWIDPAGARVLCRVEQRRRSGNDAAIDEVERRFLHANSTPDQFGYRVGLSLVYTERVLKVGQRVSVYGIAVREPDPNAVSQVTGYRDELPTRLWLSNSRRLPLLISDDDLVE